MVKALMLHKTAMLVVKKVYHHKHYYTQVLWKPAGK